MFEITPDDIALLNDRDLRTLVARLVEAEIRCRGHSTAAVTWGGHQDAKDGGIDIRVALPLGTSTGGFIPRAATGFQVKAEDMSPADVLAEMCPLGVIRPSIQGLADQSGAYIIVSSKGSVSDSALQNRREAMIKAVGGNNARSLKLDFYDRTRLATWIQDHTGMIPWVREKIGRSIPGWQPYGSWAYDPRGVEGEYLLDERFSVHTSGQQTNEGCSPLDGIKSLRHLLRQTGRVVRLVGLSGVGKTRFVQALFDNRIGERSLESSWAVYANLADNPEPPPTSVASDLISSKQRAILVIDNCGPELHRRLSELCRATGSTVSLITVEYDIQEDEPEGTEVFKILPSSDDLIEKLILKRFPHILGTNARTIANFSSGNARVAIALAETVKTKETLGRLSDADLFRRLFLQRQEHDDSLLRVAQAASLVYSFQGEDISSDHSELIRLGALVNKSSQEMYRGIAELMRRGLVQQRSVWRAVLPHAIANRLAAMALQEIPFPLIESQILSEGCERLARSFSRRLSYLHDSKEARNIVRMWLGPKGLLQDIANFGSLGKSILQNIAPTDPEATLSALEHAWQTADDKQRLQLSKDYLRLLRSIAYDAVLFERCVSLILAVVEPEDSSQKRDEATEAFISLFFIHFSGTHATIEQRLRIIEQLLFSDKSETRKLGAMALKAALRTSHFDGLYHVEFGAHPRDYGYWPANFDEVKHWFRAILKLVESVIGAYGAAASEVPIALAKTFGGLWQRAEMYDELESLCRSISAKQFWPEGWIAVKRELQNDSAAKETLRLSALELFLRPTDLVQRVRSIVLSQEMRGYDLDYSEGNAAQPLEVRMAQTEALARSLGRAAAMDTSALEELLPDLLASQGLLWSFGCGLAEGSDQPEAIWSRLTNQLIAPGKTEKRVEVLCGFINELHKANPLLANVLLNRTVQSDGLAPWYPRFEASIPIDKQGIARVLRSLTAGKTPIAAYRSLAWGGATSAVSGGDLSHLVTKIAARPNGFDVALDIIAMRIHSYPDKAECSGDIIDAGRELLRHIEFSKELDNHDYNLAAVVQACLVGDDSTDLTKQICQELKNAVAKREFYRFNHGYLLESLLIAQPSATLDELLGVQEYEHEAGCRIFDYVWSWNKNPLDVVPPEQVVAWCRQDSQVRFPRIAAFITVSRNIDKPGERAWTESALQLLKNAPDRNAVLKEFVNQLVDIHSWSGSRAAVIEANAKLLDQLMDYPDSRVVDFLLGEKRRIHEVIESERTRENSFDKQRDERFE